MPLLTILAFLFLTASLLSLWIKRLPKIWGTLVSFSILLGMTAGHIDLIGLYFIAGLTGLWIFYDQKATVWLFIALVCLSVSFKLRLVPGFHPFFITPKFALGLENPLIGLFPLALLVPLAKRSKDWKLVLQGLLPGVIGICLLALFANISGAIRLNFSISSDISLRLLSNLLLTCIPEEGFYRGFVQKTLCDYFKRIRFGKLLALVLASLLFSITHIFWAPNLGILALTFFASLLYGSVYLFSEKIESAILCHFLLNLIHMTFFSYHA